MSSPDPLEQPVLTAHHLPVWPAGMAAPLAKAGIDSLMVQDFDEPWFDFVEQRLPEGLPGGTNRRIRFSAANVKPFVWAVHSLVAHEIEPYVGLAGTHKNPDPEIDPWPIHTNPKAAFTLYFDGNFDGFYRCDPNSTEYHAYELMKIDPTEKVTDIRRHYPQINIMKGIARTYETRHKIVAVRGLSTFLAIHHRWARNNFGAVLPRLRTAQPSQVPAPRAPQTLSKWPDYLRPVPNPTER